MKSLSPKKWPGVAIRLDDPEVRTEMACQNERKNWIAGRVGLPTIGSKLVNKYGIEWVVQCHAEVPTMDSLHRWRTGEIEPHLDLYPAVAPQNLSPKLRDFIDAIDRCTTKRFAILDTMPGRRNDGHVPGGNSIDTLCHPDTNFLFLDAARVHETVIAHEMGHAWVQYVDECEDLRTMKNASDPQRMRQVAFVQSFVLDLKVNDLLHRKGFDMSPIEEDQASSLMQLANALKSGYQPEHAREEVFMALLIADEMVRRAQAGRHELVRADQSLQVIRGMRAPLFDLASRMADAVERHGYERHSAITACIDECLLASFEHCGDRFDLDGELLIVRREEPDFDKFPDWLPVLPPKMKCVVGRHMAKNEITWEWPTAYSPGLTERTKVEFRSPDGQRYSRVMVDHRIGPPSKYFGMSEEYAEHLELKRQNEERMNRHRPPGMPDPYDVVAINKRNEKNRRQTQGPIVPPAAGPQLPFPPVPGRPYMAGTGRFLTAVREAEWLEGEHPYGYALENPVTYTDPSGLSPCRTNMPCTPGNRNQCINFCCSGGQTMVDCHQHGFNPFFYDCTCSQDPPPKRRKGERIKKYCQTIAGHCYMHNGGTNGSGTCARCQDGCEKTGQWPTSIECSYWLWGMNSNRMPPK